MYTRTERGRFVDYLTEQDARVTERVALIQNIRYDPHTSTITVNNEPIVMAATEAVAALYAILGVPQKFVRALPDRLHLECLEAMRQSKQTKSLRLVIVDGKVQMVLPENKAWTPLGEVLGQFVTGMPERFGLETCQNRDGFTARFVEPMASESGKLFNFGLRMEGSSFAQKALSIKPMTYTQACGNDAVYIPDEPGREGYFNCSYSYSSKFTPEMVKARLGTYQTRILREAENVVNGWYGSMKNVPLTDKSLASFILQARRQRLMDDNQAQQILNQLEDRTLYGVFNRVSEGFAGGNSGDTSRLISLSKLANSFLVANKPPDAKK